MRMLLIGPARNAQLLEIVVVHPYTEDETIIHSMPARPTFIAKVMPHD
ncbi:MAG: hypothetical protein ACR2HR_15705 [Euzebya sp.]